MSPLYMISWLRNRQLLKGAVLLELWVPRLRNELLGGSDGGLFLLKLQG